MLGDLQNSFLAAQALYLLLWVTGGGGQRQRQREKERKEREKIEKGNER